MSKTSTSKILSIATALLVLAGIQACAEDANKPKIHSFVATPGNVPSLGGEVLLTWDVSGEDEIRIEPGVGVVEGTAKTVTVTGTTTFTLVARNSSAAASERETVTVAGPTTVVGIARGLLSREPVAGMVVWIPGHGSTVTEEDGSFAFEDVETPYDIALVDPVGPSAILYLGVTRPDPILESDQPGAGVFRDAPISGTITPAELAGEETMIALDSDTLLPQSGVVDNSYNGAAQWLGPDTSTFTVHGLRWTTGTAGVASYVGYDRCETPVTYAVAATCDLSLTAVSTVETTLTTTYPGVADLVLVQPFVILGTPTGTFADEGFFLQSASYETAEDEFRLRTPGIENATLFVKYQLTRGGNSVANVYREIDAGTDGNAIELPSPPVQLTPVSNGTVSRDTVFRSGVQDDTLKIHLFQSDAFWPAVAVVTQDDEVTIPDTREIGIDLFQEPVINWRIYAEIGPRDSVDDAVGPEGLIGLSPEFYGYTFTRPVYPQP